VQVCSPLAVVFLCKNPKIRIYLKTGLTQRIYEENIQYNTKIPEGKGIDVRRCLNFTWN
jgi:hypothetical protein